MNSDSEMDELGFEGGEMGIFVENKPEEAATRASLGGSREEAAWGKPVVVLLRWGERVAALLARREEKGITTLRVREVSWIAVL